MFYISSITRLYRIKCVILSREGRVPLLLICWQFQGRMRRHDRQDQSSTYCQSSKVYQGPDGKAILFTLSLSNACLTKQNIMKLKPLKNKYFRFNVKHRGSALIVAKRRNVPRRILAFFFVAEQISFILEIIPIQKHRTNV